MNYYLYGFMVGNRSIKEWETSSMSHIQFRIDTKTIASFGTMEWINLHSLAVL